MPVVGDIRPQLFSVVHLVARREELLHPRIPPQDFRSCSRGSGRVSILFEEDIGQPFDVSIHLDVRGLTCPMPALKSLEASRALSATDVLEVVGDWPGSKFEVPFAITGKPGTSLTRPASRTR